MQNVFLAAFLQITVAIAFCENDLMQPFKEYHKMQIFKGCILCWYWTAAWLRKSFIEEGEADQS